jgi:hypothetical protein
MINDPRKPFEAHGQLIWDLMQKRDQALIERDEARSDRDRFESERFHWKTAAEQAKALLAEIADWSQGDTEAQRTFRLLWGERLVGNGR